MAERRTTNASGVPVAGDEHPLAVGPNGPTVQDSPSSMSRSASAAATTPRSQPLWWPPDKLSGRYLVPYLSRQSGENAEVVCPSKTTASRLLSIRSKGAHHE